LKSKEEPSSSLGALRVSERDNCTVRLSKRERREEAERTPTAN
jgi:hypothetical protein